MINSRANNSFGNSFCKQKVIACFNGCLAGLTLALIIQLLVACGINGDRVSGTSSGVDNPQLTVAFRDSNNAPTRISGTLSLFQHDQNPILDATALAQIKVDSTSFVNLSALDFDRTLAHALIVANSLNKMSTGGRTSSAQAIDTLIKFNLYLRTNDSRGALRMGLTYHTQAKRFTLQDSITTTRIDITTKPLRKVQAVLKRPVVSQGLDRVFIAGTPFVAVLVDTGFVFDGLPEGDFDLKIATAGGTVVSVNEKLNPLLLTRFTTEEKEDEEHSDTRAIEMGDFSVNAGEDRNAVINAESFLSAVLEDEHIREPQFNYLWREISGREKMTVIYNPTALITGVKYSDTGAFIFEISASNRAQIVRDTLLIGVEQAAELKPALIAPRVNETLFVGKPFKVVWITKDEAVLAIEVLLNGKSEWRRLDSGLVSKKGTINTYLWTPEDPALASDKVQMRLADPKGNVLVKTEGSFTLLPLPLKPPRQ